MTVQCPECGARYKLNPTSFGKTAARVKCPKCYGSFRIAVTGGKAVVGPAEGERTKAPAPVAVAPRRPASVPKAASTILVVDDSQFFRELIVDVLKPLTVSVLTAADGMEAMNLIRRQHPALVILDLNLPTGKNGYELIRDIRADLSLKDIRLLAMSGVFRKKTDVAEVEMAGADDFISKSFTPEQLQTRVTNLLRC